MFFPPTYFFCTWIIFLSEFRHIHFLLSGLDFYQDFTQISQKCFFRESINFYSFKLCRFWGLSDSHSNLITSNNLLWAIKKSYWSRNLFFTLNKLSDITSLRFISERSWHMYELWTNIWVLNHQFQNSFVMIYYYLDCMHSVWHFFIIHFIFIFTFHFLLMNISGNTKTNVLGSIFGLSASYISCMTRFRKQRCIYPGVLCMYTY